MQKQRVVGPVALLLVFSMVLIPACVSQSQISALVTVLGNATASLAVLEGNTALGTKIKADTTTASAQILAWTKGTDSQLAVEGLNVLLDDLDLIPDSGPYAVFVDLAIGTAESLIALLPPPTTATMGVRHPRKVVYLAKTPKNAGQFKTQWNQLVGNDPKLAKAAIH